MAEPQRHLDLDDAISFIVLFLRDPNVRKHVASYGNTGYDVLLNHIARAFLLHYGLAHPGLESAFSTRQAELSVFFDAAWQLCRRGILRPGVRDFHQQGQSYGHAGQGFTVTVYGRTWLAATDIHVIPTHPGRFAELLAKAGRRFGSGFLERAQEAAAAYNAGTYLACCAMCGAAAESVLLAIGVAKVGDEKRVVDDYARPGGRAALERSIAAPLTAPVREELRRYTDLLKHWRDAAAHGRAVHITEPEAYTSLVLLLRFALFANERWAELTQ